MKFLSAYVIVFTVMAVSFLPLTVMSAPSDPDIATFGSLLQIRQDPSWQERLDPIKNFKLAADLRAMADRLQAFSRQEPGSTESLGPNAAAGVRTINETSSRIRTDMRATAGELAGLMGKQIATAQAGPIRPDPYFTSAYLDRGKLVTGLYSVSSYYKLIGELVNLGVDALNKVMQASVKGADAALLLNQAASLLGDAANYAALAGSQLNSDEAKWASLENTISMMKSKPEGK